MGCILFRKDYRQNPLSNRGGHPNSILSLQILKRRAVLIVLLLGCFFSLTGCYIKGSITDLDSSDLPSIKLGSEKGGEFVSGSDQYELTQLRRYQVMSSAGSYNKELVAVTPRGYRIYSSVQGTIISGQKAAP